MPEDFPDFSVFLRAPYPISSLFMIIKKIQKNKFHWLRNIGIENKIDIFNDFCILRSPT